MAIVTLTFNNVNGENTGFRCRSGPSNSSEMTGYLLKKNTPAGSFQVDTSDKQGQYYRLIQPEKFGLPNKKMYAFVDASFLTKASMNRLNTTSSPSSASQGKANATSTEKDFTPSITDVNTFKYSEGLDKQIAIMLSKRKSLDEIPNNIKAWGAPFQFIHQTDFRPWGEELPLGRKYLENIILESPIVNFMPGIPSYLPDFDEENRGIIENFLKARYNGAPDASITIDKITKEPARYFDFTPAYADFIKYANLLCRMASIYLGISENNVPGTATKYKFYDWSNHGNTKATSAPAGKFWDSGGDSIIKAGVESIFGDPKFIKFYVDPSSSFNESSSNSTSQSKIAGLFDTAEGLSKEIQFLAGGTDKKITDSLGGLVGKMAGDTSGSRTSNIQKLFGMADHVITGNNVIFPEIWGDSAYNKSYDFTINLSTPYGDIESYFNHIIVPQMFILALGMPRQTSANSFTSPFLVKVFAKGRFSCELGMIDSISITKGGDNSSWSIHGLPSEVQIRISVKDLYSNLMITKASRPELYFNNQGLIEFLAVNCGLELESPNIGVKLDSFISTFVATMYDIPSNYSKAFLEWVRNRIRPYYSI